MIYLLFQVIGGQSHPEFNGSFSLCDFQYLGGELFIWAKDCVFFSWVMFIQSWNNHSVCLMLPSSSMI